MLNTQEETGDPLFVLLAKKGGIVDKNSLYLGGSAGYIPTWNIDSTHNQTTSQLSNYDTQGYFLANFGDWFSVYGAVNTFTDNGIWSVNPGGVYFILGNLEKSPVYTYAALSTVNFGNFGEPTNFLPTVTRLYFMQSGGNVNLSYNTNGLQTNIVFLGHSNSKLGVANAYNGNVKLGYSLNLKYTKDLGTDGDFFYVGSAYSNVSGFTNKNNNNVGSIDFNFGTNISKFNFMNELVFTDKSVSSITDTTRAFELREGSYESIFPTIVGENFLSGNSRVYSWSSQLDYSAEVYSKELIPYISYSQIQQNSDNYAAIVESGFRYNPYADSWIGFSYSYINAKSDSDDQRDNLLSMYLKVYI